jgi:hypothetical protein
VQDRGRQRNTSTHGRSWLQFLELSSTTLDDEGLARLKDLQQLQQLSLVGTAVTDRGLVRLAELAGLQQVWVSKDRFTEEAIEKLKETRPDLAVRLL